MTTEQAIQVLKNAGYCIESLTHISDVKSHYRCSDSEAIVLLENIAETLSEQIDDEAYRLEIREI
jgi:hypothetical protein